jgi:preprotein translocase SecE subunit
MEQTQVVARGGGRPMQWLRGARDFLVAVRMELSKVSWPTQEELVKATKMVVILSAIIGVALGLLDLLLTTILLNGVAALAR